MVKLYHSVLINFTGLDSTLELTLLLLLRLIYRLTKQHSCLLISQLRVEGFVDLGIKVMSYKV